MFLAVLFIIVKISKQPNSLSIDEWIKKIRYVYTVEYHSARRKKKILPFEINGWIEGIMLREIS